jgi:hypothetical protein
VATAVNVAGTESGSNIAKLTVAVDQIAIIGSTITNITFSNSDDAIFPLNYNFI